MNEKGLTLVELMVVIATIGFCLFCLCLLVIPIIFMVLVF